MAVVILLLTAGMVILSSWQQMQNEENLCPVKVINVTANATVAATKEPQVNQTTNTTHKKTLVFLYQPNCPYCEQMKPVIDDLITKSYNGTFEVIHIDIWSDSNAVAQYKVTSTPTMVILQNGNETARFNDVVDEDVLINALK